MAWDASYTSRWKRRIGKSAAALGETQLKDGCPDVWELDDGDIAVIGRDRTAAYAGSLPSDVTLRAGERIVVIPRSMLIAAKPDIPNA